MDRPQTVSHELRRRGVNDDGAAVIELRDASKSYGAVRALRDGNLALRAGEVRALMGENGAGKSTLVKVLGGVVRRDAGEMLVDGDAGRLPLAARRPRRRHRRHLPGADAVPRPQHRGERRHGLPPARGAAADRPRRRCTRSVQGLLDRLGVRLDPERPVRGLSIADQQIVEIAKALQLRRARADHGRADRRAVRARRSSGSSRSSGPCARRARPSSSSPTASTRSSRSATPSR